MLAHLLLFCRAFLPWPLNSCPFLCLHCFAIGRRVEYNKQNERTKKLEIRSAVLTTVHPICIQTATCWKPKPTQALCHWARSPMNYSNGNISASIQHTQCWGSAKALAHIETSSAQSAFSLLLFQTQYSNASIAMHTAVAATAAAISIYIKQPWANEKHALIERWTKKKCRKNNKLSRTSELFHAQTEKNIKRHTHSEKICLSEISRLLCSKAHRIKVK